LKQGGASVQFPIVIRSQSFCPTWLAALLFSVSTKLKANASQPNPSTQTT
jgi:hypothetical protein